MIYLKIQLTNELVTRKIFPLRSAATPWVIFPQLSLSTFIVQNFLSILNITSISERHLQLVYVTVRSVRVITIKPHWHVPLGRQSMVMGKEVVFLKTKL